MALIIKKSSICSGCENKNKSLEIETGLFFLVAKYYIPKQNYS